MIALVNWEAVVNTLAYPFVVLSVAALMLFVAFNSTGKKRRQSVEHAREPLLANILHERLIVINGMIREMNEDLAAGNQMAVACRLHELKLEFEILEGLLPLPRAAPSAEAEGFTSPDPQAA